MYGGVVVFCGGVYLGLLGGFEDGVVEFFEFVYLLGDLVVVCGGLLLVLGRG